MRRHNYGVAVPRPPLDPAQVMSALAAVLRERVWRTELVPIGYGNENWRISTSGGWYLAKFGPLAAEGKWRSAAEGYRLAAEAGVPVARLVHFGRCRDRLLRVFEWVDGLPAATVTARDGGIEKLFGDLGAAVAALHNIRLPAFSSRLDGSAPAFCRWGDYVNYRLGHVRERCRSHDAFHASEFEAVASRIRGLLEAASGAASPSLCHRDLHADNLLVDEDGHLVAILDFDAAEAWDAAGEWFKLDWLLFPAFPGGEATFDAAYHAIRPRGSHWEERKLLADLIETTNVVPNAIANGDPTFEARAREHLDFLLSS